MNILEISGAGQYDWIEYAGNMLDRHDLFDSTAPSLLEVTGISLHRIPTASGLNDYDYQDLATLSMGFTNLNQIETITKVAIPPEIMEHFKHIKCHCMMGLFPEIGRAWLTIDSDIYIWAYEQNRDVAYFDGLNQLIISVGLVKPKPGVFIADVQYLLILTTAVEIIVLGVTFNSTTTSINNSSSLSGNEEMQLMNKPIFIINTDNVSITTIIGTDDNRIFLGGRDGCLYEICYQAESNWFGKRCKKINHSQGLVSLIIPGFLKVFSETDSIAKITVDNSRNLLYTLSEKGSIEAWDLGVDCNTTRRITRISQNDIAVNAGNILKTVDISVFKPIIALCPLTVDDSPNLHLLAITHAGVRIYFSTIPLHDGNLSTGGHTSSNQVSLDALKPQHLYLMHVRLPPGYTPNTTIGKPRQVHSAFYKHGTLLMVQSGQQDQDLLWSLSSEPFPWRQYLAESSTLLPLNGQVWGIAEYQINHTKNASSILSNRDSDGGGGVINTSIKDNNTKVIILTNQGVYIIALLQPTDLLEQLLIACNGPHHEAIKAYFQIQSEHQVCASSIYLACKASPINTVTEISKWATQVFLLYGGEPKIGTQQYLTNQPESYFGVHPSYTEQQCGSLNIALAPFQNSRIASSVQQSLCQQTQYSLSPVSNQSTIMNPRQPFESTNISYSAKHAGLYLYVNRLLRPIWNKKCIQTIFNYDVILTGLFKLIDIIDYILKNNISGYIQTNSNNNNMVRTFGGAPQQQQTQLQTTEYALIEEKKSINALGIFIKHTCEVISLWQILREHQFPKLFSKLPKEEQNVLLVSTFRDLILSRSDSCAILIVSLINSYLSDNATVGLISKKLRTCCPNLYRHEDAITHKATELIMLSKKCTDMEEQKENLFTALHLCKDAAPNIPLANICQLFLSSKFHQGVIELVATCANKIDPNDAALPFYKNNEPVEDQEGYIAFKARMNCYRELKVMLDYFYQSNVDVLMNQQSDLTTNTLTFYNNNNKMVMGTESNDEKLINSQIEDIIAMCLNIPDQLLLHITIYEWLLSYNLISKLLHITDLSLGEFLTHSVARNPDNLYLSNILWKYHERNGDHAAATKILENLAVMQTDAITLTARIEYLARAVLCMRSDSIGYSVHNGRLLKNLEDKLEIAQLQMQVLKVLEYRQRSGNIIDDACNINGAIESLNSTLFNLTQLYTEFAERFNLWELQLAILNCSHHNDPLLIEMIWTHLLDDAIDNCNNTPYEKLESLIENFQHLAKEFGQSGGHCFPLAFLVREIEIRCCRLRIDKYPIPNVLLDQNIDVVLLLDIYAKMISMNERIWSVEGNESHLIQSVSLLMSTLANNPNVIPLRNRRRVISKAQDLASACRNLLYPKPDKKHLIEVLVDVEEKLQRILS